MEIQFLGATKTVTGSKYLLKAEKKVMVDCGLFQGLKELRLRNWAPLAVDPTTVDAVVLTHAHLDHTGYLPLLVKNGFTGKIYATPLTIDLCKILLLDSGHIQEEEARRANKYGYSKHKPALPLYSRVDAEAIFSQFEEIEYHKDFSIGDLTFRFNNAGHIFGAASLLVRYDKKTIIFSGDLGRNSVPCVIPPEDIPQVDYIVIESTYGDRLHETMDPKECLAAVVNRVAKRGGTIIIPAFAVGRTQIILYYIYQLKKEGKLVDIPVFLDSPMAQDVTNIMLKNADEHLLSEYDCVQIAKMVEYVNSVDDSKKIDRYVFPKIIVSASGMLTGGRVLHHIKAYGDNPRNAILFAGYQAEGTRGAALLNGKKEIKIYGEYVKVNAELVMLSNMSAHADYADMLNWLKNLKKPPSKVFITHGEFHAAESLRKKIEEKFNWECIIPEYLQVEKL